MHNQVVAILAAGVAAWVFGAVWYMALGKIWQRALGRDPGAASNEGCKGNKMAIAPIGIAFLGALVMSAVLSQFLLALGANWQAGVEIGLTVGIGFLLPATFVNNMFQQKKPMVTVIDGAHWVLALTLEGAVLGALL